MIEYVALDIRIFPDGRMTAKDAAKYLGLSYKILANQRSQGIGPPFIKLGKAVFYLKQDLDAYLESCRCSSTSQYRTRLKK